MTTYHDVPADLVISELSIRLASVEEVVAPEWASIVKTGTHRERPPVQDDWWFIRSAAVLRKVGKLGPIGANHMAQQFGGPKDRGVKSNRAVAGSRNIARNILQQLTSAGLVTSKMNAAGTVNHGKVLTAAGQALLDDVANSVLDAAIERHPGLSNY
ncbi:MAG: 30S ribosomal protein S19e [Methanobacteriota archaeon]|jgi:small subunit ribosomal protein S19e|nr:30S ribosomal protein S19e [Euryarchaeota archaeon]MBC95233.1 30S ribosomal protein S19e [Euryarchaeota archaeon]RAH17274.1 MAG: 30S ribosomal protein S19e [Euryarchaeota archaeon]|tara:strand:- start:1713 stop:2183 length:471 start_codon:yes stop_codon:yes gene_type:complete